MMSPVSKYGHYGGKFHDYIADFKLLIHLIRSSTLIKDTNLNSQIIWYLMLYLTISVTILHEFSASVTHHPLQITRESLFLPLEGKTVLSIVDIFRE